jgi:hypothetical protein
MAEINGNGANTPIVNYGVSSREGKIYKSSKTEEDGYTRVELQSGGVVYHKYVNGLSGKITYLTRDEKEIVGSDGKKKKLDNLKMFLSDGTTTQALALSTYSQEWKLAIKHLFNVDFSKSLIVSFYKKQPEGSTKSFLNLSVKYEGEETADGKPVYPEWLDTTTTEKGGTVPPPTKNRKDEWDWTDNDLWYLDKLTELVNRYMDFKNANKTDAAQPKAAPQASAPKEEPKVDAEPAGVFNPNATPKNDLPF